MKKVFITGSNGFVGRHLIDYFKSKNIQFIAGVREEKNADEVSYGDLSKLTDDGSFLKDCDQIVHLAARVHMMNEHEKDPLASYITMNTESTVRLAEICQKNGIKKFIYISTIKVNGEKTESLSAFKADDQVQPIDPYAISKYEAEKKLLSMHKPGLFEVVIIRPCLIYGADVKGNLKNLMKLVNLSLPLPFALANNQRSLISVYNLCDLILTCLQKPEAAGQIFLASDDHDLSLKELIQKFAFVLKKPARLFPIPISLMYFIAKTLGRLDYADRLLGSLQVDIEKTKKVLNWKPPFTFEDTFKQN